MFEAFHKISTKLWRNENTRIWMEFFAEAFVASFWCFLDRLNSYNFKGF